MIRVMIVEDEPPIMRAIASCIRQDGRFSVTATAMTGKRALELMEQEPADVVFTDIRMPVMDGLALVGRLRERFPGTLSVIVSGYQDFEYMRTAIREQVTDYLLKPVTAQSLAPVLDKLAAAIGEKRDAGFRHSMEASLFQEAASGEPGLFSLLLLCAGPYPLVDDTLLPGRAFWNAVDPGRELSALFDGRSVCLGGRTGAEMAAVLELDDPKRARDLAYALWKRLNTGELPVTVAFSPPAPSSALGETHKNLRHLLHTDLRLFHACVLEAPGERAELHPDPFRQAIGREVRARNAEGLRQTVGELVEAFTVAGSAEIQLVHFLEAAINDHLDPLDTATAALKLELRATVSNAQKPEALAEDIAYLLAQMFGETSEEHEREPALIAQMEEYLQTNYSRTITNAVLSERFGFVPSYISKLFRTHRGVSPSEYLTKYRIERAKEMLSGNPSVLMKEVAAATGFSDQYYFSKIFKKEMGVLPTEYAGRVRAPAARDGVDG